MKSNVILTPKDAFDMLHERQGKPLQVLARGCDQRIPHSARLLAVHMPNPDDPDDNDNLPFYVESHGSPFWCSVCLLPVEAEWDAPDLPEGYISLGSGTALHNKPWAGWRADGYKSSRNGKYYFNNGSGIMIRTDDNDVLVVKIGGEEYCKMREHPHVFAHMEHQRAHRLKELQNGDVFAAADEPNQPKYVVIGGELRFLPFPGYKGDPINPDDPQSMQYIGRYMGKLDKVMAK